MASSAMLKTGKTPNEDRMRRLAHRRYAVGHPHVRVGGCASAPYSKEKLELVYSPLKLPANEQGFGKKGFFVLSERQFNLSFFADPSLAPAKAPHIEAIFKLGNYAETDFNEHGLFLRLAAVYADKQTIATYPMRTLHSAIKHLKEDFYFTKPLHYKISNGGELDAGWFSILSPHPSCACSRLQIHSIFIGEIVEYLVGIGYLKRENLTPQLYMYGIADIPEGHHLEAFGIPALGLSAPPPSSFREANRDTILRRCSPMYYGDLVYICPQCKQQKKFKSLWPDGHCLNLLCDVDPREEPAISLEEVVCEDCLPEGTC